jgi:hypothetical protein
MRAHGRGGIHYFFLPIATRKAPLKLWKIFAPDDPDRGMPLAGAKFSVSIGIAVLDGAGAALLRSLHL